MLIISQYCGLYMQKRKTLFSCHMNKDLWRDQNFCKQADIDIKNFFLNNLDRATPLHTVWDAAKASFKGFMISYMACKNKNRKQIYNKIFADLKMHELSLQQDPSNQMIRKTIQNLQHKINMRLSQETAYKTNIAKQKFFQHVNEPGKWLSYKICKIQAEEKILQLQTQDGSFSANPGKIKDYIRLLLSDSPKDSSLINDYLQAINFPKLDEFQRQCTNPPLTAMELNEAIIYQKAGTDGIPAEIYHKFNLNISELLKNLLT